MKRDYMSFDDSIIYQAKMIPLSIDEKDAFKENSVLTDCRLTNIGDGFIRLSAEGFHDLHFVDKHFEFLLYTKEIRIKTS